MVSLSKTIARHDGPDAGPEVLDRVRLETWLTDLAVDHANHPAQRTAFIRHVGLLLRDNLLHDWLPEIPRTARFHRDAPTARRPPRRAISDYVLRQLDNPAALARFPSDDGRLLIRLGLDCGLRLGDACQLPFDCVLCDADEHPYLAWITGRRATNPTTSRSATTSPSTSPPNRERWKHGSRTGRRGCSRPPTTTSPAASPTGPSAPASSSIDGSTT